MVLGSARLLRQGKQRDGTWGGHWTLWSHLSSLCNIISRNLKGKENSLKAPKGGQNMTVLVKNYEEQG
jgi:hypothetical protein